jgi:hypothetical protein
MQLSDSPEEEGNFNFSRSLQVTTTDNTKKVDLVFLIDSSNSMKDEASALSARLNAAIEEASKACPSDLRVEFLGIEGTFGNSKFDKSARSYLTGTLGVEDGKIKGRKASAVGNPAQEDVAPAAEDIIKYFDWRKGAERNLFVLGDESLYGGEMVLNAERIKACDDAIDTALAHTVKVHSYLGTPHHTLPYPTPADEEAMVKEYKRLALRTGGEHYIYTKGIADFSQVLKNAICASKVPHQESVEEKKEEADKLEGKDPVDKPDNTASGNSNLCEQLPEIVKAVNTLADVLKGLVESCAPSSNREKHACHCHEHDAKKDTGNNSAEQSGNSNPGVEEQPQVSEFVDKTMFTDGDWNQWEAGPVGHDCQLVDYAKQKTKGLYFKTAANKAHAGTILKKTLVGLEPGQEYSFLIRAKRVIGKFSTPKLSLSVDGKDISGVVELITTDEWVTIKGNFTAGAGPTNLEVISHENDSNGNDYHVGRLVIANPGNPALDI